MEQLLMQIVLDILYRLRSGQSERAIARDLGHARATIRHYHRLAKEKGYLEVGKQLPELSELLVEMGASSFPPANNISTVEPYREIVKSLLDQEVEMVAIHKRLVKNYGYTGGYSSVRRFVSHLMPKDKKIVVRIERALGESAQVDFGGVGKMRDPASGKDRTSYCFVMTLSYSRHQYVEFVFDQKMETWIGCHVRAFEFFGGAPRELVIDNLKAAVIEADLVDAVLSEPYRKLARHYGVMIHPCRVATPTHKGIVENGVHYVQRNFIAGDEFVDIHDANRRVRRWIIEDAGTRDHGTTHEQPIKRFYEHEKAALLPLPVEPFDLLEVRQVKLHRDCHVRIDGSYYSAPFAHVGKKLDAYVYSRLVCLYDGLELVVSHPKATRKGQWMTRREHYPPDKSIYITRTRSYCERKAAMIGPRCASVVRELLAERPLDKLRSVQGIIGLADKYGERRLEAACARALHYSDGRYRRIKGILDAGLDQQPLDPMPVQRELRFHEYARDVSEFFGPVLSPELGRRIEGEVSRC